MGTKAFLFPSVEQFRMKVGKTMMAKVRLQGIAELQQKRGQKRATAGLKFPAQVLPNLQGRPSAAKKHFY